MAKSIAHIYLAFLILIASLASAQNASASIASANIFLPTPFENTIKFAASIVGVCQGQTTYGVRCTRGVLGPRFTCGPDTPDFTVTEASDSYVATRTSKVSSAIIRETQTCSLQGTTRASCTVDLAITGSGKTTMRSTSSILSGTDIPQYYMFQMPITANAQYLHATGSVFNSSASRSSATFALGGALSLVVLITLFVL